MTPEQWESVRPILESALELAPQSRAAFLDKACPDLLLRHEVESLIAFHEQAGTDVLKPGSLAELMVEDKVQLHLPPGKLIGAYEIIEEIAVGGMGTVYRARRADGQYQQQVALKIVRSGLGAESTAARFRGERQILASLDHPNIAKLLDGGATADGLPYFVMEYIDGLSVTEYCDRQKLSIDGRLQTFRTVCSAVHYAHQHLVIHRDIKPSNILVTTSGSPRLLDFGIAKILDPSVHREQASVTFTGLWVMTPEYASPEQLRGDPITTATDVYSLGLVLYELLTGRRPYYFPSHMPHEVARVVLETDPEKPSVAVGRNPEAHKRGTDAIAPSPELVSELRGYSPEKLRQRISGDLDNIVLKAIRKEAQERYSSADQLSEDLRRYLEHMPVVARRSTLAYRFRKYVVRHKVGATAAALVFLSLLTGIALTVRAARIARAERARAEQRFNDVRELAKSNLFELHDAIQQLPGSAPARHLVIQRSLQYLDKLSQEAAGNRELLRELAVGYERIAGLQGNFSGPGIGDYKAALASYQKALSIRNALAAMSKDDPSELAAELPVLGGYSRCSVLAGRMEEASGLARRELGIAEQIAKTQAGDIGARADVARAHMHVSVVLGGSGSSPSIREVPEAILHDRQAIDILKQLAQARKDARTQRALLIATNYLAFHLAKARQFEESVRLFDEITADQKSLPPSRDTLLAYNYRGLMFDRLGDPKRALASFQVCSRIARSLAQADPHDLWAQIDLDNCEGDSAIEEARLGSKSAALTKLRGAIEDAERLLASNASESFYKSLLLIGYSYQAEILSLMGDHAGAQTNYSQALATAVAVSQGDPQDLESRLSIAKIHAASGVVLARAARYVDAKGEFSASLEVADDLLRSRPADAETLHLSGLVRDYATAVKGCQNGGPCKGVSQFQVPSLNN